MSTDLNKASATGLVIVGGGLAAVRMIQTLRASGYDESITMLTEESVAPYDRPPLSKDFLTGDLDESELALLTDRAAGDLDIRVRLDSRVVRLDRAQKVVVTADGARVPYQRLVIATGARARQIPGLEPSARVHYLRTVGDAIRLRDALATSNRVLVVGSGFIGLEVASSAKYLNKDVRVVAADHGPMINIVGRTLSSWIERLHTEAGIPIYSSTSVVSVSEGNADVTVRTDDGVTHRVDLVVVGAGIARELDWLNDAGVATDGGLLCDADGRSSDTDVFGVGDIVCRHTEFGREDIQHWTAAAASARRTAHALVGAGEPTGDDEGYFWTEQHGCRLQFVGTAHENSTLDVIHGDLDTNKFVAEVTTEGAVSGVFASNSPREFLKSRKLFQSNRGADPVAAGRGSGVE